MTGFSPGRCDRSGGFRLPRRQTSSSTVGQENLEQSFPEKDGQVAWTHPPITAPMLSTHCILPQSIQRAVAPNSLIG